MKGAALKFSQPACLPSILKEFFRDLFCDFCKRQRREKKASIASFYVFTEGYF
jgi:hypothetical protein